jgi:PAS domain S-box-containing protein
VRSPVALDEVLGKNIWEEYPEHIGTVFDHEAHRAVREQTPVSFEAYSPLTRTWQEGHAYPSNDGGLSVYSHDITERKRAEEQLAYHASLLDNVEDGVIATDAEDFRITAWNKGAERRYGFAADEVLGPSAREVASFPGDEARVKLEDELFETGRTRIEFTARRKDGSPVEVELIAVAVKNDRGDVTGYLGIHRDITERKRIADRVEEAREAERSRIARALHDEALQSLVNAVGLAITTGRALPPDAADQLVSLLRDVGQQLRAAIYDLRLGTNDEPFATLLQELVEVHQGMAGDFEIDLQLGEGTAARSLGGHGRELLRIIGEALTNARRHADASHIHVRVWGSKTKLCAEVSDDGRGFDTSQRASPGHAGIQGMRERAELVGGRLEIRSDTGVGTTVRLAMPVDQAGTSGGG